jgi:hypothetical protein
MSNNVLLSSVDEFKRNFRDEPSINGNRIDSIYKNVLAKNLDTTVTDSNYVWQKFTINGKTGWLATKSSITGISFITIEELAETPDEKDVYFELVTYTHILRSVTEKDIGDVIRYYIMMGESPYVSESLRGHFAGMANYFTNLKNDYFGE